MPELIAPTSVSRFQPQPYPSSMSDEEVTKVIQLIDEALSVFQKQEGNQITVKDISVKSMLMALRAQMMNEQRRVRETA